MNVRRLSAVILLVLLVALPATAQEPPLPVSPHGDAALDKALSASWGSRNLNAYVWAYQHNTDPAEACVQLSDEVAGRFEFGCGEVELEMEPTLGSASVHGTIPSFVSDGERTRASKLTIDLRLEGTGVPQAGIGQGSYASPPWLDAYAGGGLWRAATGSGRVDSAGLCAATQSARPRRPRGRRPGAGCTAGTGTVTVQTAELANYAGAWVASGEYDECGKERSASGC